MLRIKIRQQERPGAPWRTLCEPAADPLQLSAATASENDMFSIQFFPEPGSAPAIRLSVGNVVVASTIPADRVHAIDYDDADESEAPPLVCRGRFLADYVGITALTAAVDLGDGEGWKPTLALPLAVSPSKLDTDQFAQLFAEFERDSAAVLLDVHGKTQIGLKAEKRLVASSPVAVLAQVRSTVAEMTALLHRIARNPASRLRNQWSREEALDGQAVSDATLDEATRDPTMFGRRGSEVILREHLVEFSRPDFRIPEHRVAADFSEYLKVQLADLRHRIDGEIAVRQERKSWRNQRTKPGQPTWWETEDLPRIEAMQDCRQELAKLHGAVDHWANFPFLPPGRGPMREPVSTPLFRNHPVYRRLFRVIAGHFLAYRATLDTQALLTGARSLPVLYEWWCAIRVIRTLTRGLQPLVGEAARPIVSNKMVQEGERFTVEFQHDQAMDFEDKAGNRVRFRYQPAYTRAGAGVPFGVLDALLKTPDLALEIYPASSRGSEVPDLIVVLDAKYSSLPQAQKMAEVATKYAKIGDARTGRILSRQVWAMTPAASEVRGDGELAASCTVDNAAFWSPEFDLANPVNGAIQTVPVAAGGFDPIQRLIALLLKRAKVEFDEG